nr:integrase domain-containing protein [Bordetella bronchiseptica]
MSLQLQAALGLRREEAIRFQPSNRGNHIALKGSWTKGGRERTVPITTTEQRDALQAAHHLAGIGSLTPANKTYIQQRSAGPTNVFSAAAILLRRSSKKAL